MFYIIIIQVSNQTLHSIVQYEYASDYKKSLEQEIDETFWSENSGE